VSGTVSGAPGHGLGPRFNADSCAACHSQPAIGGTSPATNPEIAIATKAGATNTVPSFITANGPVREARFIKNPDGTADGGVHDLFVITGRTDATGCNIQQPNFAQAIQQNNIIFAFRRRRSEPDWWRIFQTEILGPTRPISRVDNRPWASRRDGSTPAAMTAPSRDLDGRHRTSRC